jgi:membrane-bound ClpP family serine protease
VNIRLVTLLLLAVVSGTGLDLRADQSIDTGRRKVYVLPIREAIMPPLVYLVRRGVKEAMDAKADLLVLDKS